MTITLEISKLSELLSIAAENGAKRALEETGAITGTITSAEVKKMVGRRAYEQARMSPKISWMPNEKGGKTSGVYCKRSEFDRFLFEREFDFNH